MNDKVHLLHKTTPSRLGNVAVLSNMQTPIQRAKEIEETEYIQNKKPDDSDKEFKIMVVKMLTEVGRTMHKQDENFNKDRKKIQKYQTEITDYRI